MLTMTTREYFDEERCFFLATGLRFHALHVRTWTMLSFVAAEKDNYYVIMVTNSFAESNAYILWPIGRLIATSIVVRGSSWSE